MYKILRIICCVICALLLAACVFIFVYCDAVWGIATVIGAAAFFALTILFKNLQEDEEKKKALQADKPDESKKAEDPDGNTEQQPHPGEQPTVNNEKQ